MGETDDSVCDTDETTSAGERGATTDGRRLADGPTDSVDSDASRRGFLRSAGVAVGVAATPTLASVGAAAGEGERDVLFTGNRKDGTIDLHGFHVYDVAADRITRPKRLPKTEHVPADEDDYPLQSAHHGIDVSGDGEYICVAGTTSWYAAVVRRSDLELVDYFEVGEHPYWVQTAPDGEHAFVAIKGEDAVSTVSYEEAAEVARIPAGDDPMVMEHRPTPGSVL